jgi:hypothetical protein
VKTRTSYTKIMVVLIRHWLKISGGLTPVAKIKNTK